MFKLLKGQALSNHIIVKYHGKNLQMPMRQTAVFTGRAYWLRGTHTLSIDSMLRRVKKSVSHQTPKRDHQQRILPTESNIVVCDMSSVSLDSKTALDILSQNNIWAVPFSDKLLRLTTHRHITRENINYVLDIFSTNILSKSQ